MVTYQQRKRDKVCLVCGNESDGKWACSECRSKDTANSKGKSQRLKDAAFEKLGGYKCSCPGCDVTQKEFLTIDHVNNDGAAHRKLVGRSSSFGSGLYRSIVNGTTMGFELQVLCANCQYGKLRNQGCCPHCHADAA